MSELSAQVREDLDYAIQNPAFDRVSHIFGETLPDEGRLDALQDIASRHWDYRRGRERQAIDWNESELFDADSPHGRAIFEHTGQLGLVASTHPTQTYYNFLGITGAANKAPMHRLQYAVEHHVSFGRVVLLGCDRFISDAEREKVAEYAPDAVTEFDLMCGAAKYVLGARKVEELVSYDVGYDSQDPGRVHIYEVGEQQALVFDAPAPVGRDRANTGDTYAFMRAHLAFELDNQTRMLFSTNAFYSAYQDVDARRLLTLPTGVAVETIGFDANYGGVKRLPAQLLQETKSYIDAMVRLDDALRTE